jgi:hypothetical protein
VRTISAESALPEWHAAATWLVEVARFALRPGPILLQFRVGMPTAEWAAMNKAVLVLGAWLAFGVWLAACADPESDGDVSQLEAELERVARADAAQALADEEVPSEVPYQALMRDCFARAGQPGAARGRSAPREAHTIGQYLALGDTMLAVYVPLPDAPELARCIEEAVADEAPPGPPSAPNAFASGSFAVDLGGPPPAVSTDDIARHLDAHRAGLQQLVRQVVARGVLPADHFFVREVLEGR